MTLTATLSARPAATLRDIVLTLQVMENYGTARLPYWKPKGGSYVVLTGFSHPLTDGIGAAARKVVDAHRASIEIDNDYCRADIVDWTLEAPGAHTPSEDDQLKWDGDILFASQRIAL